MKSPRIASAAPGTKPLSPAARARLARGLERDGVVVFDRLFPLPWLARVRAEVLRRHESGELRERGLVRDIAGRLTAVLPFKGPFLDPRFHAHPALWSVVRSALGADARLSSLEVVIAEPGAARQYRHADAPLRFDRASGARSRRHSCDLSDLPPYALALATPLCAIDEENGPTALWPGSHRTALRFPLPKESELDRRFREVRMTGPMGFSYLYDYRTFHRGLPNESREVRPLLMVVFARPWFRDPNLDEVGGGLALSARDYAKLAPKHRAAFASAPPARREPWG